MIEKVKVDKALKFIVKLSIDRSSQVLSKMIKSGACIDLEQVYIVDISALTEKFISEPDQEVVCTFIDLIGDAPFKFLFYVSVPDSMVLTDLILRRDVGSTKEFNLYASSAVQEIGNVLSSAISNVFASDFQISMTPSPPKVINDYASAIFNEYIMSAAIDRNEVLIIESIFRVVATDIKCRMFILPVGESEKILAYVASAM